MAAIKVLIVGDGPRITNNPDPTKDNPNGISFAPARDPTDDSFTISEFTYLLTSNQTPSISVDTAHRNQDRDSHNNPYPKFENFNFATTTNLLQYDVIWLFGYDGWNGVVDGVPILQAEIDAITAFMASGGGVFATGDHAGMGSFMCGQIPRVRTMRKWFGQATDLPANYPTQAVNHNNTSVSIVNWPAIGATRADTLQINHTVDPNNPPGADFPGPKDTDGTSAVNFGNYRFDDQSDNIPQPLTLLPPNIVHPILLGPNGEINQFPDHMHEGEVVTPANPNATLPNGDAEYPTFPAVAGYQPLPSIIATGDIRPYHKTWVDQATCDQSNFSDATDPTAANTIGILCVYDGRGANVGRIVTDSSFHHYLDINIIGDPCGSTPDRTTGFGAPYVPPPSGSVLAELQAFYVNTITWLARLNPNFYFAMEKSTYSFDEASPGGSFAAFSLVVNGYTYSQVNTAVAANPPQFSGPFANLNVISSAGPLWVAQPGDPGVQTVRIPYTVQFSTPASLNAFPQVMQQAIQMLLQATLSIGATSYAAETTIELTAGANPWFQNINPTQNNAFYLSQDLCVFTLTPGLARTIPGLNTQFPADNFTLRNTSDANTFIQQLLKELNSTSSFTDPGNSNPFANFPSQAAGNGDSSVSPIAQGTSFINYNFAVARVRLNGSIGSSANPVKVFFRLFLTQTNDTDYQPDTTYRSTYDAGGFPDQPLAGSSGSTQPFFADSSAVDYAANSYNNRKITVDSNSGTSAYFGCHLDVYSQANNSNYQGTHHCIVAQIAYDNAPIVNSNGITLGPENSDKLAQRNLQITSADNPGSPAGDRVPQTFDLRPSPPLSPTTDELLDYPDELMIDWGSTPLGSTASIYWPQVNAIDVVRLARLLYGTEQLTLSDPHTLQCKVTRGVTYVPIPSGSGQNFAGLFTIDLPSTVVVGQEFNVVVKRISSRRVAQQSGPVIALAKRAAAAPGLANVQRNWRYVVGTFQVKIPIGTKKDLLPPEETTYAILLWRLGLMAPTNRWYPVMQRYLSFIAARIHAWGGNPGSIVASPNGVIFPVGGGGGGGGVLPGPLPVDDEEFTGKVVGIAYDRFGDFEGFLLFTEAGHEHKFHATEAEIERLVRFAWIDRVVISVLTHKGRPERPVKIILRRAPEWPEH